MLAEDQQLAGVFATPAALVEAVPAFATFFN